MRISDWSSDVCSSDLLAGGPGTTAGELAQALGLHPRPAEMLLTGCAALGLLEKTDGRYRNTPLSEAYLVRGKPYYFGGFVQMADKRLYAGWGKLTEALRTNRPTTWDRSEEHTSELQSLMRISYAVFCLKKNK